LARERKQACSFGVGTFGDTNLEPVCIQSIQKLCQESCSGTIDLLELREIDVDRHTTM
jgi:hypothetical protein